MTIVKLMLTAKQYRAFRLYQQGLSQQKIAEQMDCTQSSVSLLLKRVKKKLNNPRYMKSLSKVGDYKEYHLIIPDN